MIDKISWRILNDYRKKNQGRRKRVSERGRERIIKEGEGNERKANKRQLAMERDI